jgi:acetyl esterase/lipase
VRVEAAGMSAASARVLRPAVGTPRAAVLWFHGGGLILGRPEQDDARCAELVRALGVAVVVPRYRLAPEHPFPAALDDGLAAWRWLHDHLDLPRGAVAVGGESAGGGLAAALAQRLRDLGGPQPACQVLVYPMLDDRTAADRGLDGGGHVLWNNHSNRTGWSAYLGGPPGAPTVPRYASPARRSDLGGLPPAWIGVGTLDLFLAEDRDYARRLTAAGVPCDLDEVPGAVHGFLGLAPGAPISRAATRAQVAFLRRHLGLDRSAATP